MEEFFNRLDDSANFARKFSEVHLQTAAWPYPNGPRSNQSTPYHRAGTTLLATRLHSYPR